LASISIPLGSDTPSFILLRRSGSGCSCTNILDLVCLFGSLVIFSWWDLGFCISSVEYYPLKIRSLRLDWHGLLFFVVEESKNVGSSFLLSLFWHFNYLLSWLLLELEFKTNRPKKNTANSLLL
jgi:hypothetical protein